MNNEQKCPNCCDEKPKTKSKSTSVGNAEKRPKSGRSDNEKADKKLTKGGNKKLKLKIPRSVGIKERKKKESTTGNTKRLKNKKSTPTGPEKMRKKIQHWLHSPSGTVLTTGCYCWRLRYAQT